MTCLATLTLAAIGPWTYAGFLADPPSPTPPAPTAPASPLLPPTPNPVQPPAPGEAPARPSPPSVEAAAPPSAVRKSAATSVRYRMPDATGQVWEHADPAWLQTYVMDRNRQFVRACVNGSCR